MPNIMIRLNFKCVVKALVAQGIDPAVAVTDCYQLFENSGFFPTELLPQLDSAEIKYLEAAGLAIPAKSV